MATIEAASDQSAKLPSAGSTPAVASEFVWVFNRSGQYNFFPVGIFTTKKLAGEWILSTKQCGVLTRYYLNKPDDTDFPDHEHFEEDSDFDWLAQAIGQW